MCWDWFKKKETDSDGIVPPWLGYVVFPYDKEQERALNAIMPQWVRIAITAGEDVGYNVNRIRWYRQKGVLVILCLWNNLKPEFTPVLARQYALELKSDVYYECGNEPNTNIAPAGEPNSFVDPDRYVNIYNDFRRQIINIDSNAKVIYGGINGQATKYKEDRAWDATKYLQRLWGKGIQTDYFNFHCYTLEAFYRNLQKCRSLDKNKKIIIGEFPVRTTSEYDTYMSKFTLNRIDIAVAYALSGGNEWSFINRPEMMDYIASHNRR